MGTLLSLPEQLRILLIIRYVFKGCRQGMKREYYNLNSAVVRAPRMLRQVHIQGCKPFSSQSYLWYVEHENGEANAVDLFVWTFECRTTAGFRYKLKPK